MTSKKSIFEKLKLIEAIEEPEENKSSQESEESFFLNPKDEEIQAEFESMLNEEKEFEVQEESWESETNEQVAIIEASIANDEELDAYKALEEQLIQEKKEAQPFVIEDKLNTLIEAYEKNKLLTIEEIYRTARLTSDSRKSIFIADVFLKTLPENLPVDIKRTSLLNILNVSNISIEELLTDAFQRIDSLNTVLENTVNTTDEIAQKNDATIRDLEKRIEELRNVIEARRKFQEDQNTLIEYEIQRIINIVDFIKPKK